MSATGAIIDKLLTNVSQMLPAQGMIADLIFPNVKVKQKTGKLAKYGKSHLRIDTSITGGRGSYRRVEPIVRSNANYQIDSHGLEGMVTEDDYDNVELPYDAEYDEMVGLMSQIEVEKESVVATALADTSVVTQYTTLSGTSQFSDLVNSSPLSVFKTGRNAIKAGCGVFPDVAWMDSLVAETLCIHPEILDVLGFKYARSGGLTYEELAKAMKVRKLLVADSVYNTAKEGQSDSLSSIWGKHIWFGVCPDNAMVRQVSAGYKLNLSSRPAKRVFKYAISNPPNSTGILCDEAYQFLLSDVTALYKIESAIA